MCSVLDFSLAPDRAAQLARDPAIVWHQRLQLSKDVISPGVNDIEALLDLVGVPARLDGLSVLDIGTCNGGAAFIAEQRGAERVVAVDIYDPSWFGFDQLAEALDSKAEFVKASVYQLPGVLAEEFDIVLFLGVLYHLRHPLLAIDSLRTLTRGRLYIETAVCADDSDLSRSEFHPGAYHGDSSNWFIPSERCLRDWFTTSGFAVERTQAWPAGDPGRALLVGTPTERGFLTASYEVPLEVSPPPKADPPIAFR
jgi:tRNA (mo5U34)-methyltransferase